MKYDSFTKALLSFVLLMIFITPQIASSGEKTEIIKLGKWNQDKLQKIIANKPETTSEQIDFFSEQFLGTPYEANTLTGDINTPEIFTVDLKAMDCFTYIDYVEALRLSVRLDEFDPNLKDIRYKNAKVSFQNRNHFFSDWPISNNDNVTDVTYEIGGNNAVAVEKSLNLKSDGSTFLPGIPVVPREFYYIPSSAIDDELVSKLRTGDYIGMYTEIDGLDVTHTGIVIKQDEGVFLRHASSKKSNQKVVDENLKEYTKNVPGIVVYRPR